MNKIAVFCGASSGSDEEVIRHTSLVGSFIAGHGLELVYGGAKVGLMGILADAVLKGGGKVTGVLPAFLVQKEIAHEQLTELILVNSMHERKLKMHELCDGVIALPGGYGTMDELFEVLTWAQLGLHKKPIGLLNINGFYDDLLSMVEKMVRKGFLKEDNLQLLQVSDEIEDLFERMEKYEAPVVAKLIAKENT